MSMLSWFICLAHSYQPSQPRIGMKKTTYTWLGILCRVDKYLASGKRCIELGIVTRRMET